MNYRIRNAVEADSEKIGLLHASSWRKTYRGLLSDEYLDTNLEGERKTYWASKMANLTPAAFVLIAERDDMIIGFVAVLDKPERGYDALIDNLHVQSDLKGQGIGKQLMKAVAEKLTQSGRKSVYLWVLKGNDTAEQFYFSRGAQRADVSTIEFGGKVVEETRFVWEKLDHLLT